MRLILKPVLFLLFFTSCAIADNGSSSLFQSFLKYKESATKENINDIADNYFSHSLLGEGYQNNSDAKSQLLFQSYMESVDSHYERVDPPKGCLIINGYGDGGSPVTFSLEYIVSNERWLINQIHVGLVESKDDFVKGPKCPGEYMN